MPTKLRLLRGPVRADRVNAHEPEPQALKELPAPASLEGVALLKWQEATEWLASLGMLSEIDTDLLTLYCEKWSDWTRAKAKLKEFGEIVKGPKTGYPIQSPYVNMESRAWLSLLRAQAELGLTPSSRSRVHVPGGKPSKLERFLSAKVRSRKRA